MMIFFNIIWIILGIINFAIMMYDDWKYSKTKIEIPEIIFCLILNILVAPITSIFIIYYYIKFRRDKK